jgi:hypothetical protein
MTERSSFITEYIYCPECFATMQMHFGSIKEKYLTTLDSGDPNLPIIGGKIGGLGPGDDLETLTAELSKIRDRLCHPVRVVLIAETGEVWQIIASKTESIWNREQLKGRT